MERSRSSQSRFPVAKIRSAPEPEFVYLPPVTLIANPKIAQDFGVVSSIWLMAERRIVEAGEIGIDGIVKAVLFLGNVVDFLSGDDVIINEATTSLFDVLDEVWL